MAVSARWRLYPLHLYFVRTYLGLEDPTLPLEAPSYAHTRQQYGEVGKREYEAMREQGLIVDDEIAPVLARALTALVKPYLWVDSLWFPEPGKPDMWRAVAVVAETNRIVLGVQPPGEPGEQGGPLTVEIHENTTLGQVLLPTLPPAAPGSRGPALVPTSSFRTEDSSVDEQPRSFLQPSVEQRGSSGDRQLATYRAIGNAQHVRAGQFAANMRDRHGRTSRSQVLSWFDNAEPDGRYLDHTETGSTGERLYGLTPADARLLGNKVEQLAASVR